MTEQEFSAYVVKYRQSLLEHAYSVVRDWTDAEDAVQEGLFRLYNRYHAYDPKQSAVYSWMATSVLNCCKNVLKQRKQRVERETSLDLTGEKAISADMDDHITSMDVKRALEKLPLDERTAMVLFYIEGYTTNEIAKACKVSEKTVDRRLDRGRDKIGAFLNDYAPIKQSI